MPAQEHDWAVPQKLAEAVSRLSLRFTRGGDGTSADYLQEDNLRRAYLAYFLPVNLAKIQALLREMPQPGLSGTAAAPFRVLDFGAGPGTGLLAVLDWAMAVPDLVGRPLELLAVDRSVKALQQAEALSDLYRRQQPDVKATVTTLKGKVPGDVTAVTTRGPFDLVILANVLNEALAGEIDRVPRLAEWLAACAALLKHDGTLMLVEPALREASRTLHEIRNALLVQPDNPWTVFSPCLHHEPCPALAKPTDWCHEERPWQPPAFVSVIDRSVGFIKDALKFSYLLLRKDGCTIVPRQTEFYRVVSELREMKGEKRAWLCHETGRPEVGRLDRERSPSNEAVDHWHRGAIVRISEIVRKERKGRESTVGRIPSEATVEIIRPVRRARLTRVEQLGGG